MKREGLDKSIQKITRNNQKGIGERIEDVFHFLDEKHDSLGDTGKDMEIPAYSELIEMIKEEDTDHEFDLQYLQLLTLLAEQYVKNKDYRKLKKVAIYTLDLLRMESTAYDSLEYTIPRIADALEYSVYNHFRYEILLYFIRSAYKNGKLDEELKFEVKQILKLRLLLNDIEMPYGMFDKELVESMTKLFTPHELMDIILHPSLNTLKVDPVEYTWEWENVFYQVEDQLDLLLADVPRGMGFCHHYWRAKEDLLKDFYNIKWRSPSMMNPEVMFD